MKTQIKKEAKDAALQQSHIAHNLVDIFSSEEKVSYLSSSLSKFKADSPVDLIAVTDEEGVFKSILKSVKGRRSNSFSYICGNDELIGAVRAIESIIATRSILLSSKNVNTVSDYNASSSEKLSTVVVAFDLSGSALWQDDNRESFLRIAKMMEIAHVFGISFTFFNLAQSVERLNLEFYSNPSELAAA